MGGVKDPIGNNPVGKNMPLEPIMKGLMIMHRNIGTGFVWEKPATRIGVKECPIGVGGTG